MAPSTRIFSSVLCRLHILSKSSFLFRPRFLLLTSRWVGRWCYLTFLGWDAVCNHHKRRCFWKELLCRFCTKRIIIGAGGENWTRTFCVEDRCCNHSTTPAIGCLKGYFCAVTHYPATAIRRTFLLPYSPIRRNPFRRLRLVGEVGLEPTKP